MREHPDPLERAELTAKDELVAELVGVYASRRERGEPTQLMLLVALAAANGPDTAAQLHALISLYEALLDSDS